MPGGGQLPPARPEAGAVVHRKYVCGVLVCVYYGVGWVDTWAHHQPTRATHNKTNTKADGDDVDPEAGDWELLYLVQRPNAQAQDGNGNGAGNGEEGAVVLAGYLTIYAFNNPLKGKGLRVCQALVLPPFQRQGVCVIVFACVCLYDEPPRSPRTPTIHHPTNRTHPQKQATASTSSARPTTWRARETLCLR